MFCVKANGDNLEHKKDSILIATPDSEGKKLSAQIVDLVYTVLTKWYPCYSECYAEPKHSILYPTCNKAKF